MSNRIPFLQQVNVVNKPAMNTDGEVYTANKKIQIVVEDDSKFVMSVNHIVALVNGITSIVDVHVMNWISANVNFNDNTISLNKFYKTKMKEFTGHSYSAIERSIGNLVDKKLLVRDQSGPRCATYHVNPSYIWYGDKDKRVGKMKFVLELLQYQELPDKEKQIEDDIKRYEQWYKDNANKQ